MKLVRDRKTERLMLEVVKSVNKQYDRDFTMEEADFIIASAFSIVDEVSEGRTVRIDYFGTISHDAEKKDMRNMLRLLGSKYITPAERHFIILSQKKYARTAYKIEKVSLDDVKNLIAVRTAADSEVKH